MQDVRLPVSFLKVGPREAHNYQGPMQPTVDWNQEKVLAEDIHQLHTETLSAWQLSVRFA